VPEPVYDQLAAATLDKLEHDPSRRVLWDAICDAIDLVCDHPDSAEARRQALSLPSGERVWLVPIDSRREDENWALLWRRVGDDAAIHSVGPWPPTP
jgi:hypothetical protein